RRTRFNRGRLTATEEVRRNTAARPRAAINAASRRRPVNDVAERCSSAGLPTVETRSYGSYLGGEPRARRIGLRQRAVTIPTARNRGPARGRNPGKKW